MVEFIKYTVSSELEEDLKYFSPLIEGIRRVISRYPISSKKVYIDYDECKVVFDRGYIVYSVDGMHFKVAEYSGVSEYMAKKILSVVDEFTLKLCYFKKYISYIEIEVAYEPTYVGYYEFYKDHYYLSLK